MKDDYRKERATNLVSRRAAGRAMGERVKLMEWEKMTIPRRVKALRNGMEQTVSLSETLMIAEAFDALLTYGEH